MMRQHNDHSSHDYKNNNKTNHNNLLNFHFSSSPNRESLYNNGNNGGRGRGRGAGRGQRGGRYNNNQYQYNYRSKEDRASARKKPASNMFYLHSSPDHAFIISRCPPKQLQPNQSLSSSHPFRQYTFQGPDAPVSWESVRMVRCFSTTAADQQEVCPICLDSLVCARITKCGHAFCLPCLLQHMHVYQDAHLYSVAPKCPCCALSIYLTDLRPVVTISVAAPAVHARHTLVKLRRVRTCPAPYLPRPDGPKRAAPFAAPTQTDDDARFCKFNYVDPGVYQQHLRDNLVELASIIDLECELQAISLNWAREVVQDELSKAIVEEETERSRMRDFSRPTAGVYQSQPEHLNALHVLRAVKDDLHLKAAQQEVSPSNAPTKFTNRSGKPARPRSNSVHKSVACLPTSNETETVHSVLCRGNTVPCSMYCDEDTEKEFYQAEDGTLCFLSSFCDHQLKAEYSTARPTPERLEQIRHGSELNRVSPLPDVISGTVMEIQRVHLTESVRQRVRFLEHLPLYSDIVFVELDLKHLLSSETNKLFAADVKKRQNNRKMQSQAELKAERMKQRSEERRISLLKERLQRIDPNDEFFHYASQSFDPPPVLVGEEFGPRLSDSSTLNTLERQDVGELSADFQPSSDNTFHESLQQQQHQRQRCPSFSLVCQTPVTIPGMGLTRRDEEFPMLESSSSPSHSGRPVSSPTWGQPLGAAKVVDQNADVVKPNPISTLSGKKGKFKGKKLIFTNGHHCF